MEKNNREININNGTRSSSSIQTQQEGTTIQFNTRTDSGFTTTTGVIEEVTPNAEIVVENGVANNPHVDQRDVQRVAEAFEDSVHPTLDNEYGQHFDIDNNGRITIYLLDIRLEDDTDNDGRIETFTTGYHDPVMYDANNPNSDERDAIYMDVDEGLDPTFGTDFDSFNTTMAQEYAHAIIFNYDGRVSNSEEDWLNEALATHAEFVVYGVTNPGRIAGFEQNPNNRLTTFNSPNIDARYGASFLFAGYLSEHYPGVIRDLVRDPTNGIASVNQVLNDNGFNNRFEDVFRDWTVANRINDDSIADQYGYTNFDVEIDDSQVRTTTTGRTENDRVRRTTADYWTIDTNSESVYHQFNLPSNTDDVNLIVVAETQSDGVVTDSTGSTSSPTVKEVQSAIRNRTTQQPNVSAQAPSSSLLSSPPITSNNTVTNADEYDEITVIIPNPSSNSNYDYALSPQRVPTQHTFTGTLDDGESATYVIPVNKFGVPKPTSGYEYNGDVFTSVWDTGGEAQVSLTPKSGSASTNNLNRAGVAGSDLVGENPLVATNIWVLETANPADGDGSVSFQAATRYKEGPLDQDQVFTLPSDLEISVPNDQAGSPSGPAQVTAEVTITTAGAEYTTGPFPEPTASDFDVLVGGDVANVDTVERLNGATFLLRFTPPTQSSAGNYKLSVAFSDEKFGITRVAQTAQPDAISYSGAGGAGATSVALVIDRSGSMSGNPSRAAKDGAIQFQNEGRNDEYLSVVSYADRSRVDVPMQQLGSDRSSIRSSINSIGSFGSTNIGAGLKDARTQLTKSPSGTSKAAILLSDGNNNVGFTNSEVVDIARTFDTRGYRVYTIGLGNNFDRDLLQRIADQSGGDFRDVSDSSELIDVYRDLRGTTSGGSTIQNTGGIIQQGGSDTQSVSVDQTTTGAVLSVSTSQASSSSSATVAAQVQQSSPQVRLFYPNGTAVQLNQSTTSGTENPNISYRVVSDTTTYRIEDPAAGDWSYRINNPGSSNLSYNARVTGSTRITMTALSDGSQYLNGSAATLSALVVGPNGGLTGATVTATVTLPNGTQATVPLTDQGQGRYEGTLAVTSPGSYQATITARNGTVSRQQSLSWSVVEQSSVLSVTTGNTSVDVKQSQTATVPLTLTRPQQQQTSPTTASATTERLAPDFDEAAQELGRSSAAEIRDSEAPEALKDAALTVKNVGAEGNSTGSTASANIQASSSSTATVYVRTSPLQLQAPGSARIPAANVAANVSTLSLARGDSRGITVSIAVPDDAPPGVYTGSIRIAVDGVVITRDVRVTVSPADRATYIQQIIDLSNQWKRADPPTKGFLEKQIADQLTQRYFNLATANASSAGNPTVFEYNETPADDESVTIQPGGGGVYTHQFSVETNATTGPLILGAYLNQSTDLSFESSTVVSEGSRLNVDVNVSNVTVAGDDLTRIQLTLTNRSQLQTQTDTARTLDVEMNFQVASTTTTTTTTTTTERIQTGGTHGQSGQVLRLEQTDSQITISRTVDVGGVDVPVQFTTVNARGDRIVTSDGAVDAIRAFLDPDRDVDSDTAVSVIRAFLQS